MKEITKIGIISGVAITGGIIGFMLRHGIPTTGFDVIGLGVAILIFGLVGMGGTILAKRLKWA